MNINALHHELHDTDCGGSEVKTIAIHADPDMTLKDFMLRYATRPTLIDFNDHYKPAADPHVVIELRLPIQDLKETP